MNEEPQNFTVISVLAIKANQLGYDQAKSLRLSRHRSLKVLISVKIIVMYDLTIKRLVTIDFFTLKLLFRRTKLAQHQNFAIFHQKSN